MQNNTGSQQGLLLSYAIKENFYFDQSLPRVMFLKDGIRHPGEVQRLIQIEKNDLGKHKCTEEIVYLRVSTL